MSEVKKNLSCSFCHKLQTEVKKLIAGPDVYICDDCIRVCSEILIEGSTVAVITNVPSCRQIMTFLDQYVIGQHQAKMVMSVAINNHYKRLDNPVVDEVELDKGNVIITGPSGSGKCLAFGTKIRIRVDESLAKTIAAIKQERSDLAKVS